MGREIKFRAWRKNKTMVETITGLHIDNGIHALTHITPLGDEITIPADSFELEQYTGLKDRNGVEIFENDLLKNRFTGLIFRVVFQNGAFLAQNRSGGNSFIFPAHEFEIIGNLHENPESIESYK